jgi:hypothetical protein
MERIMDDVEKEILELIKWIEVKGFSNKDVAEEVTALEELYDEFDEMDRNDTNVYGLKF